LSQQKKRVNCAEIDDDSDKEEKSGKIRRISSQSAEPPSSDELERKTTFNSIARYR